MMLLMASKTMQAVSNPLRVLLMGLSFVLGFGAQAADPPQCVVPAKPGGGMDITCKLAQRAVAGQPSLQIRYQPGGIGAVAWSSVVSQRRAEPDTLVAFSGGSLLNLALGKFGRPRPPMCAGWRRSAPTTA